MLKFAVFIFLASPLAYSSSPIKESQDLFLKEGRLSALKHLVSVIDTAPKENQKKFIISGEKLATRFKTDEAQREFEQAESLYFSGSKGALNHYLNAEKIEFSNIQVMYSKLRHYLSDGLCSDAESEIIQITKLWPHSVLIPYYRLNLEICNGTWPTVEQVELIRSDRLPGLFYKKLLLTAYIKKGLTDKAMEMVGAMGPKEKAYSEFHYWAHKANELAGRSAPEHLKKYIDLCNAYEVTDRRKLYLEPLLCKKQREAIEILKKLESEEL